MHPIHRRFHNLKDLKSIKSQNIFSREIKNESHAVEPWSHNRNLVYNFKKTMSILFSQ